MAPGKVSMLIEDLAAAVSRTEMALSGRSLPVI